MQVKTLTKVSRGEEVLVICDQRKSLSAFADPLAPCSYCVGNDYSPNDVVSVELNN